MVAGFDGMPEGITALGTGDLEVTASQPLDRMAQLALDLATGMSSGKVTAFTHHVLDVDLVTQATFGDAAMRALRVFPELTADMNQQATEQKNNATFLETLFDVMPTMVLVKAAKDLRYVRVNRAREAWLIRPTASNWGKPFTTSTPPMLLPDTMPKISAFWPAASLWRSLRKNPFWKVLANATRERGRSDSWCYGHPDYLMVIAEDITGRSWPMRRWRDTRLSLRKTNQALKRNHEKLVETEKMAALGVLVAGISHELNTPIGNALMAITTYADHTHNLAEKTEAGLTRSMLTGYLSDAATGIEILERNLRRAAELIQSFKQISIDQSSSQARSFNLATVVRDMLVSLSLR